MNKTNLSTWVAVLMLATGLLVSGCGGGKTVADVEKPFIYLLHADASNLDPQDGIDSQSTNVTNRKIYENLVTVDKEGTLIPALATEWKQVDPLTLEFTLREGVKFHDGTDFNATAVKATFDRLLDPDKKRHRRTMFSPVVEIKVIDESTIQFITDKPFVPLLLHFSHPAASIMSPKAIEEDKAGTLELSKMPIGTGPFKMDKWVRGESITLKRHEEYWGEKPIIKELVFKTVTEDITRMAMVKQGEAQAAEMVPVNEVARLSQDSDLNLLRTLSYRVEFLALNVSKGPMADIRVRQAVSEALDYDAILSGVYSGVGQKGVSNLGPDVFGYNPNLKPYEHNLDHAKQLMKEAGYDENNRAKVVLITANRKIRMNLAEVMQAQLKEIGIDVEIQAMEFGTYIEESSKGQFDLNLTGWSNQIPDGDYSYASAYTARGFATGENNSRYNDPKVNALIDAARQELDPEKRQAIYWEIQEIVREDRPTITTQVTEYISVTQKNVAGLWVTPGGVLVLDELTFK